MGCHAGCHGVYSTIAMLGTLLGMLYSTIEHAVPCWTRTGPVLGPVLYRAVPVLDPYRTLGTGYRTLGNGFRTLGTVHGPWERVS